MFIRLMIKPARLHALTTQAVHPIPLVTPLPSAKVIPDYPQACRRMVALNLTIRIGMMIMPMRINQDEEMK